MNKSSSPSKEKKKESQDLSKSLHEIETSLAKEEATLQKQAKANVPQDQKKRDHVAELIETIRLSADKLSRDQIDKGDLKMLSRSLKELRYAFKVFSPYRTRQKVTVFGSARTTPDHPAYQQAVKFGKAMAEEDWLVVTGAASGIMEAGHVGAGRKNAMGINIMLPFEAGANPIIEGDSKLVNMRYFFTRKVMFIKECDAVCLLPGGFGTLDEAFEVLTLVQTGKSGLIPIIFLDEQGGTFWKSWNKLIHNQLLKNGLISEEDLSLYKLTDSVEEAVEEIQEFYRVYHSMRFVGKDLIIRLKKAPSESLIELLNDQFSDILSSGEIKTTKALKAERNEKDLLELPRLILHFNRRNLGRLRQMINVINQVDLAIEKTDSLEEDEALEPSGNGQR
ncbi:Cytochrome D ubiquinol oxidase subunit II [Planctomycetales bacterium 10988]|nr:Cytochrome D ubiquinol oxidase subunit II [Planctomycetales bacterium 10988]